MSLRTLGSAVTAIVLVAMVACGHGSQQAGQGNQAASASKVVIQSNGTVDVPARSVPLSSFLTPAAKSYMIDHLQAMQNPAQQKFVNGVPVFMQHYLERDEQQFALNRTDEKMGGVHVYVYVPKAGIAPENRHRVLINLHGGGFSGCWPGCAELESMPISALMRIKVVTVDYREGPEYKFPAASEDVAKVYGELLKSYKPKNIGIYGCSAGGMQTAMSLAWFQAHHMPTPGADGIFCASAGDFGGDATYIAFPLGEARMPANGGVNQTRLGYFSNADMNDPLVHPAVSQSVLAKFPPTLIITATRDFAMSGAIHTDILLTQAGVDSELHVWDGLFHGFFYNADVLESKQAFDIIGKFFDRHLGKD
jgi:epsilon-lactone hydrolase